MSEPGSGSCGLSGVLSAQQTSAPAVYSGQHSDFHGPAFAPSQGVLIALVVLFAAHLIKCSCPAGTAGLMCLSCTKFRSPLITRISGTASAVNPHHVGPPHALTGVSISGEILPASTVVIAMGAWSGKAQQWLKHNTPAFSGQKAHSIIVRTTDPVTAHCLFLNHKTKSGAVLLCICEPCMQNRRQTMMPFAKVQLCSHNGLHAKQSTDAAYHLRK